MHPRTLLVALLAALVLPLLASPPAQAWTVVFSDYFDGSRLDGRLWKAYHGRGHDGFGVRRPGQVAVRNGQLVLTAQMRGGVLHTGGVTHRRDYAYGRFEFRVRTERDPSSATSGVLLTWPRSGDQLRHGENDMYETGRYGDRASFFSFIHFGRRQYNMQHRVDAAQWHDMVMEWEPRWLRIYRDGTLVRTITDPGHIPHTPHHLVVQLDAVSHRLSTPVRMYVDYVRIYRR